MRWDRGAGLYGVCAKQRLCISKTTRLRILGNNDNTIAVEGYALGYCSEMLAQGFFFPSTVLS